MDDRQFDTLARILFRRQPRRALASLLGATLAASLGGRAGSGKDTGGGKRKRRGQRIRAQRNNHCAHFCNAAFPPGPARGRCKRDAAHGRGPCHECGPEAAAGHPDLCGQACCPAARPHCVEGSCLECADHADCGAGRFCNAGTCCTPPNPVDICRGNCTCASIPVQCGPPINCGQVYCAPERVGPEFPICHEVDEENLICATDTQGGAVGINILCDRL